MSFPCAPYETVQLIIEKLSFSGKWGLSLDELWGFIQSTFNQTDPLDDFQKQTIWQWLFFMDDDDDNKDNQGSKIYVAYNSTPIQITPDYKQFTLTQSDLPGIKVLPDPETQAFYLTGVRNNKMFLKSLGEKPYELLQEIAKHGTNGIWSPDLCEATGQDKRSLTARLKKLEELRLINKENRYYVARKVHSNWMVHVKFATSVESNDDEQPQQPQNSKKSTSKSNGNDEENRNTNEVGDDTDQYVKSREQLRVNIIDACRDAPHQIRVFRDLKKELRMDQSVPRSRLFSAMVEILHKEGIVERVNITDSVTGRLIYAIKFLKDPDTPTSDLDNKLDELSEMTMIKEEEDDDDVEDDGANKAFPLMNTMFPMIPLVCQAISNSKSEGITSRNLVVSIYGDTRHRLVERSLEELPSYFINGDSLEPSKVYPDENDEAGIIQAVEATKKLKFYKYLTRENCQPQLPCKNHKKTRPTTDSITDVDFRKINKSLFQKVDRQITGLLFNVPNNLHLATDTVLRDPTAVKKEPSPPEVKSTPKKATPKKDTPKKEKPAVEKPTQRDSEEPEKPTKSKKRKVDKKVVEEEEEEIVEELDKNADIVSMLTRRSRRTRKPPIKLDDGIDGDLDMEEEYKDDNQVEEVDDDEEFKADEVDLDKEEDEDFKSDIDKEEEEVTNDNGYTSISDVKPKTIVPQEWKPKSRKKDFIIQKSRLDADSKGYKRRQVMLDILREDKGVTFTGIDFRRTLDERLGDPNNVTDRKTIARDVAKLTESGAIESEALDVWHAGRITKRFLIISTEENYRPTADRIEEIRNKATSSERSTTTKKEGVRTVASEYTLFKIESPFVKRSSGRLESISNKTTRKILPRKIMPSKSLLEEATEETLVEQSKEPSVSIPAVSSSRPSTTKSSSEANASIVHKKFKRKAAPIRSSPTKPKSERTEIIKLDKDDRDILFRCVCISKTFNRTGIDFKTIRELFNIEDVVSMRKTWTHTRKVFGGGAVVEKGIEEFQRMVTKGIEVGAITVADLEDINYRFYLNLWANYKETDEDINDIMPLFKDNTDNRNYYDKTVAFDFSDNFVDITELASMVVKETHLANTPFFLDDEEPKPLPRHELDDLRTILKAIFGTSKENSKSNKVTKILSEFDNKSVQSASSAMIRDRELVFFEAQNETNKELFQLTEKVYLPLSVRLQPSFFTTADHFKRNLLHVINANKGFIVSQGISSGNMAQIFELLSSEKINISRIDQKYKFTGYESRAMNKSDLDCDIVLSSSSSQQLDENDAKMSIPVPVGKPCTRLWVDIDGQIDAKLWKDILVATLHHIHFRPGAPLHCIFSRFQSLLSSADFKAVIEWLCESEYISKGPFGGYFTTSDWLSVLGS
ncbi:hypothetical protein SBY92_003102 [Candida maltosa Xu316]